MTQQTTNETTERERQAFEAAHAPDVDPAKFARYNTGDYIDDDTFSAFHWWMKSAQARAALPPTSGEPLPRPAYDWCPECHARDSMPEPVAPAAPVADTGAVAEWQEPTGAMWCAGRDTFLKYARQWEDAKTSELASVIADIAPGGIFNAMRAAKTTPASPAPTADSAADARWNPTDRELVAMQESARDSVALDFFDTRSLHIQTCYEESSKTPVYEVCIVHGNIEDDSLQCIGTGATLRAAIDAAMSTNTGEGEG